MLFAPYIVFVGFCIVSLVVSFQTNEVKHIHMDGFISLKVVLRLPETLEHDSYYCTLNFNPL